MHQRRAPLYNCGAPLNQVDIKQLSKTTFLTHRSGGHRGLRCGSESVQISGFTMNLRRFTANLHRFTANLRQNLPQIYRRCRSSTAEFWPRRSSSPIAKNMDTNSYVSSRYFPIFRFPLQTRGCGPKADRSRARHAFTSGTVCYQKTVNSLDRTHVYVGHESASSRRKTTLLARVNHHALQAECSRLATRSLGE